MAQVLFQNNAVTTLAGAITATALQAALSAGSGVEFGSPQPGQYITCTLVDAATGLLNEIVRVTAVSNDTVTMARGQQGTTALNWNAGDFFSNLLTAGDLANFLQLGVDPPDNFAVASMTSSTTNGVTTNAYTIAWNLTQTTYAQGNPQGLVFFTNPNTSTTCTLNDGTGAKPLLRANGLPPAVAAGTTGADVSGYCFVFLDGQNWRFSDLLTIGDVLALIPTVARPQAKANQTFYVSPSGSDSNPGTSANPFLTPGRAVQAAQGYDYAGLYTGTIQFANGTYTGKGIVISGPLVGSPAPLFMLGNSTSPSAVLINTTDPTTGLPSCFNTVNGASINVNGFAVQSQNGHGLYAQGTGSIIGYENMVFGACPNGTHVNAILGGECILGAMSVYTISGSAQAHFGTDGSGSNIVNNGGALNITVSGTPAFSAAFAAAANFSNMKLPSLTFSGAATGQRYTSASSLINTYGGGASYFPGSTAGASGQSNYA